jgi:hypothetical protein
MSRRRADMLTAVKQPPEPRKRIEPNGIMEQLVRKKSRRESRENLPYPIATLSDVISSPSRPPLPTSPKKSFQKLPSTRSSRRGSGELTITNMFAVTNTRSHHS